VATIKGTSGDDTLRGSKSADDMYGRQGDDVLYGLNGADILIGDAGNNKLYGGRGDDVLYGDDGRDTLRGGAGDDRLEGGYGKDLVIGGAGDDNLSGFGTFKGGGAFGIFKGGAGDDVLWGSAYADRLLGGAGDDVLFLRNIDIPDRLDGGPGIDTLQLDFREGTWYMFGGDLDLTTTLAGRLTNIERIDLTNYRRYTLTLGEKELLDLSSTTDTLIVEGRSDGNAAIDIVGGFTDQGIHDGYHRYQVGTATLLVDTDITNVS
jgi:Ca2+-binding RTX toxin-like protein